MQHPEILKREIKAIAFDQYGTIVDMQAGLVAAVTPFLRQKGWQGEPNSFVTWWRRTHFENSMIDALLHREHTSYREIGHRSVAGRVFGSRSYPNTASRHRGKISGSEVRCSSVAIVDGGAATRIISFS